MSGWEYDGPLTEDTPVYKVFIPGSLSWREYGGPAEEEAEGDDLARFRAMREADG